MSDRKKKLALIHTVSWYQKAINEPFADKWIEQNVDVEIINIMDDSLLAKSLANGGVTPAVIKNDLRFQNRKSLNIVSSKF